MAKRRCTRREKAEEIAEFLFTGHPQEGATKADFMAIYTDMGRNIGTWDKESVANWIETFLRSWTPPAKRRKKGKVKR